MGIGLVKAVITAWHHQSKINFTNKMHVLPLHDGLHEIVENDIKLVIHENLAIRGPLRLIWRATTWILRNDTCLIIIWASCTVEKNSQIKEQFHLYSWIYFTVIVHDCNKMRKNGQLCSIIQLLFHGPPPESFHAWSGLPANWVPIVSWSSLNEALWFHGTHAPIFS